ncbi:hypothetical protein SUGI_0207830 [Cryptomeria japonica]|nr:hypothetical protein SUGI_0207830 [Cryptomeria japonica]
MKDGTFAQPNAKRCREVKSQAASSFSKRHKTYKKSSEKSVIDSEELVAQIHPKEITNAKQITGEGEVEGSKRKDRLRKGVNSALKWNDEEEVCLAMALLESCPPGGKVNIAGYYQRAKAELDFEVSNDRLNWKMKRMRKRFRDIQNKLKEQNIEEDNFAFRTPHEPALFMIWKQIWGQNNDFLQTVGRKLYPGDIVAENPYSNEGKVRSTNSKGIDPENPNSKEVEAENPTPMEVVVWNPKPRIIEAEKATPRRIGDESSNSRILEAGNSSPRINEAEKLRFDEFVNPNSNKIEGRNPKEGDSGLRSTACGDGGEVQHKYKQQKENEEKNGAAKWQSLQESPSKETKTDYVSENGRHQALQGESRDWKSKIQCMIHNTQSRLEEVMENCVSNVIRAANFQTLGGFEAELGMGMCGLSSATRRMKQLIDRVDFVEQFHGVDSAEAQELQRKWNKINIQKMKIFSEHLELLNDQCKLFLKTVEQQRPQECPHQEILLENQRQNWLRQCKNRSLQNNIQSMIKNTESKPEAVIENSISCTNAAFAGSFQPSGGFGSVAEMGSCVFSSLSRRMQELMDDVNLVEEFPCGDAVESWELQQKWRKIKIQKVKTFSENLELLNDECKLLLKSVEISNGCHRS